MVCAACIWLSLMIHLLLSTSTKLFLSTELLLHFLIIFMSHYVNMYTAPNIFLSGKYPRARYVVGKDAKFVWLPLQWLPEWLGDFLIDKLAKDKPIPRACRN